MEKSNDCFDTKLPSNLKFPLEENVIIAGCDTCQTFGYHGDVFYMGSSDFTGPMTDPHLCQRCFRRHAAMFFKRFEKITGCRVKFIETVLEEKSVEMDETIRCVQMVSHYDLPTPTTPDGDYNIGWYMKLLERLIELTQNEDARKELINAKFLNSQKKY